MMLVERQFKSWFMGNTLPLVYEVMCLVLRIYLQQEQRGDLQGVEDPLAKGFLVMVVGVSVRVVVAAGAGLVDLVAIVFRFCGLWVLAAVGGCWCVRVQSVSRLIF